VSACAVSGWTYGGRLAGLRSHGAGSRSWTGMGQGSVGSVFDNCRNGRRSVVWFGAGHRLVADNSCGVQLLGDASVPSRVAGKMSVTGPVEEGDVHPPSPARRRSEAEPRQGPQRSEGPVINGEVLASTSEPKKSLHNLPLNLSLPPEGRTTTANQARSVIRGAEETETCFTNRRSLMKLLTHGQPRNEVGSNADDPGMYEVKAKTRMGSPLSCFFKTERVNTAHLLLRARVELAILPVSPARGWPNRTCRLARSAYGIGANAVTKGEV